jgi:ankyrin repeat protein
MFAPVIALLVYFNGGLGFLGMSGPRDTANLAQGLSIGTEAKMLINEHWAMTGALPCEPGELDFRMSPGHGPSVLAAIDVTGCGQVTLVYNDESGLAGRRMVIEAEEVEGSFGIELAWRCWTPDFPDIEKRIRQCTYEDRQLAAVSIPEAVEALPDPGDSASPVTASVETGTACRIKPAIYHPVFTDGMHGRLPRNQLVSYAPGREQMVFFTEVIGAAGKNIIHKWFFDATEIADYSVHAERDRWPTWSTQRMGGLEVGKLRVDVYDGECLIGQATIESGDEKVADTTQAGGWMRPTQALEFKLAKPQIDYATTAGREPFVDDLTDNGDTLLLAAIRRGDTAEALTLITRVKPVEDPPPQWGMNETNAYLGRHYRRADPFLRDADGVSPIQLAHQLGQEEIVEALILSAITIHRDQSRRRSKETRFSDSTLNSLLSEKRGFMRFDDGDTPLLRAVRTNNERAVLTMLRLPGWNEQAEPYNPPVDIYAFDADGRQALTIAREQGFYAIDRFLSLATTRKSAGWAVSRSAFATRMQGPEPGDCREVAFEDEERLHFFTELSGMAGKRIAHEWRFDRELVARTDFDVTGNRWSTHSSRDFSPADVGAWDVSVVTDSGEVLRTERLHYKELTDYNRKNRDKMLGACNVGASAFSALVKAQAPLTEIEYLIGKGTVVKPKSYFGKGLISRAIIDGNIPFVGWFLDHGLDIDAYVDDAETPLLLAVKNGNAAMALYLITQGADVRFKRNRDGQSALKLSVIDGNVALARILLEQGADPNGQDDGGYTALHRAVWNCDAPNTLALLEHGADPGLANKKGEAPRDNVARCDRRESWQPPPAGLASLYTG